MIPALMETSFLHEGFSVFEAVLQVRFHNVRASMRVVDDTSYFTFDVTGSLPPKTLLSRMVVQVLNLDSYILHLRPSANETSSARMDNIIRGVRGLPSGTSMSNPLYVVSGLSEGQRSPLSTFATRTHAEEAVTTGALQGLLGVSRLEGFDNLVVEKWQVGDFHSEDFASRLTLYALDGTLLLSLPDSTSRSTSSLGRLSSILTSTLAVDNLP